MSGLTGWVVAVVAIVVAGVIGFFIGRQTGGTKQRIEELEAELESRKEEIKGYRKEVETHFDKTATLFVSMAGSYKELFEHLSSGYEKLSAGSARELFKDRVTALLLDASARKDGEPEGVFEHNADKAETTAPAVEPSGVSAAATPSEGADADKGSPVEADEPGSDTAESETVVKSPEARTAAQEAPDEPEPARKDAGEGADERSAAKADTPAEGAPAEGAARTEQPEVSEAGAEEGDEGRKAERK